MTKKSQKALTSKTEIIEYLSISETLFTKFIKAGMPALFLDGRWYAHGDNLDEWFRRQTMVNNTNLQNTDHPEEKPLENF